MAITVSAIDREFTPAEVEAITGVSTALQRDWRRRGIIRPKEDAKWTRFGLRGLIEIMALKIFTDAGHSVKEVSEVVGMVLLPTYKFITAIPEACEWEADFEVPEKIKSLTLQNSVSGSSGRYLAMAPGSGSNHVYGRTARFDSLDALSGWLFEIRAVACTILDIEHLALTIVDRAGPVIRFEATKE